MHNANIDTYNCQGRVNPQFLEKILERPDLPEWIRDAPKAAGHPDETDIENLKKLVRSI